MGRMLDSLRHRKPAPEARPALVPADGMSDDEAVPYIEVGGPNKQVLLSPGLIVAHAAQPALQPPHASMVPAVTRHEPAPMSVAFAPWPGPLAPSRIAPEIIAYHRPDHAISREYAALLPAPVEGGRAVLLFAGLRPNVGTTTVLLNLAVCAARAGQAVLVVDAHTTGPDLAERLGLTVKFGLQDVLGGSLALEQAILATALTTLHALPANPHHTRRGILTEEAAAWLLVVLRERFDLVLIDGPSLDTHAELAALAPRCDGVYLVLSEGEKVQGSHGPAQVIARHGGRLCGLIHTHFAA